jgi:hypothetical protein
VFVGGIELLEIGTWNIMVIEHKLAYRFIRNIFLMLKIMNLVMIWGFAIIAIKFIKSVLLKIMHKNGTLNCVNINSYSSCYPHHIK